MCMLKKPPANNKDLLLSRIIPHYNTVRFSHSMPMTDVCRLVRGWFKNDQELLNKSLVKLQGRIERDTMFKKTARTNAEKQRIIREKLKTPWKITNRKIEIFTPQGIQNTLKLKRCREIIITPKSIFIFSGYLIEPLEKRLQNLFEAVPNADTIKYAGLDRVELKIAVPLEFTEPEYMSRLSANRRRAKKRPYIESLYSAQIEKGVEIECYQTTGYKDFTFINENGKICKGRTTRNKTQDLRVASVEFQISISDIKDQLKLPRKCTYKHAILKLKEFVLLKYLFDNTSQAKIPFWDIPEPWLHAPQEARFQPYDIIELKKTGKRQKQTETYPWLLGTYKFDITRITYIHDQLIAPWECSLRQEWETKYPYIFHGNSKLQEKQLESQFRAAHIFSFLPHQIKLNKVLLILYSVKRIYQQKHLHQNPQSLLDFLDEYGAPSLPDNISKDIEYFIDKRKSKALIKKSKDILFDK